MAQLTVRPVARNEAAIQFFHSLGFDVGRYQMHIYCQGEQRAGTPTVVLDASYPATVSRLGVDSTAGSDHRTGVPTIGPEPGPYILVGHS